MSRLKITVKTNGELKFSNVKLSQSFIVDGIFGYHEFKMPFLNNVSTIKDRIKIGSLIFETTGSIYYNQGEH